MSSANFEIRKHAHEFQGVNESIIELVENELDVVAFVHREELARPFAYALDMLELLRRVAVGEQCAEEAARLINLVDSASAQRTNVAHPRRFDGVMPLP